MELAKEIILETKGMNLYSLKDQLCRSAISIPSNIAEGYKRQSNKEFIRFLYLAKGSCGELRTQLYLLKDLDMIISNVVKKLILDSKEISAMLYSLIQTRAERF